MPFARSNGLISSRITLKLGKELKRKILMSPFFSHFKTNQLSKKHLCYSPKTSKLVFLAEHQCAKTKWLLEVLSSQNLSKTMPASDKPYCLSKIWTGKLDPSFDVGKNQLLILNITVWPHAVLRREQSKKGYEEVK